MINKEFKQGNRLSEFGLHSKVKQISTDESSNGYLNFNLDHWSFKLVSDKEHKNHLHKEYKANIVHDVCKVVSGDRMLDLV